jgi:hypothetical protein
MIHLGGDFELSLPQSLGSDAGTSSFKRTAVLSPFATYCVTGRHRIVRQLLERNSVRNGKSWQTLVQMLERRETAMRYTPLLLVICMLRKLGKDNYIEVATPQLVEDRTDTTNGSREEAPLPHTSKSSRNVNEKPKEVTLAEQNLVKVVSVLLHYGARPDAKDVMGRTACFYGASTYATDASLLATTMCIGAAVSAHCFGKEIVLRDMPDAAYNGMHGIAAGYKTETARRIIYLFGRKTEEHVRNRNFRLLLEPANSEQEAALTVPPKFNLCDVQDRLGKVCLAVLFHSKRVDVAIFLMHKHDASIDIPDWHGDTLRANSLLRGNQVENGVGEFIAGEVIKRARVEQRRGQNNCSACGKTGAKECPLRICEPWCVFQLADHFACSASSS